MAAIDVGTAATDRGSYASFSLSTYIDYNNAANDTGSISSVEAWWWEANAGNSVTLAIYQDNGSGNFTCMDTESIGEVSSGSKQTYSGLSLDINTGEFIGGAAADGTATRCERDTSGYSGIYYDVGNSITPTTSYDFTLASGDCLSLYGTGETAPTGWTNIAKISGVTATDIAKVDGVLVADIAKINGVAV